MVQLKGDPMVSIVHYILQIPFKIHDAWKHFKSFEKVILYN